MSSIRELNEPSAAAPLLIWSGVTELPISSEVQDFRGILTSLLPRRSSDEEIIGRLADLRSRMHGWLHQDEFGPDRKQRTAALRAHLTCFQRLQKQLLKAPFRLKRRINEKLTVGADPAAQISMALYKAALDVETDLRGSTVPDHDVVEASRLRQQVYKLLGQPELADTETDGDIYFTALLRNFDISQPSGTDVNIAAVERWLERYGNVVCETLDEFSRRRGPDERVSLKLLVYELCGLWESETGSAVCAHGIVKNQGDGRAVTDAGRFITAAVELMLPDQSWLDQRSHLARSSRSATFLPGLHSRAWPAIIVLWPSMRIGIKRPKSPLDIGNNALTRPLP